MSLPYLRNQLGVAHGNGVKEEVISSTVSTLSLNIAAALCTFVIDIYKSSIATKSIIKDFHTETE